MEPVQAVTKELETLGVDMESKFNERTSDALMRAAKVVFGV